MKLPSKSQPVRAIGPPRVVEGKPEQIPARIVLYFGKGAKSVKKEFALAFQDTSYWICFYCGGPLHSQPVNPYISIGMLGNSYEVRFERVDYEVYNAYLSFLRNRKMNSYNKVTLLIRSTN